jgi:hypothetical protein
MAGGAAGGSSMMSHSFATYSMGHPIRITQLPDGSMIPGDFGGRTTQAPVTRPVSTQTPVCDHTAQMKLESRGTSMIPEPGSGALVTVENMRPSIQNQQPPIVESVATSMPWGGAPPLGALSEIGPGRPARGAESPAMEPMRLDNHHPLRVEAGHETGVAIQPRTRSSGSNISDKSIAAEFGRRVPRVTMFREMKSPLGRVHSGDQTRFDPKGVFPSTSQGPPSTPRATSRGPISDLERLELQGCTSGVRNMPGTSRNPAGPVTSAPTALLRKNLAMAKAEDRERVRKGKAPAAPLMKRSSSTTSSSLPSNARFHPRRGP